MYKITSFFLLLFMFTSAQAQDITIQNIEWNVSRVFNSVAGEINDTPQLIIKEGSAIQWKEQNGVIKNTYAIEGTIGAWTNISQPGSILFKVSSGSDDGNILISKSGDITSIRITLVKGDTFEVFELTSESFKTL